MSHNKPKAPARIIHGDDRRGARAPEYRSWAAMIARCYGVNFTSYPHYGGRGIEVCASWRGEGGYVNFLTVVGRRPTPTHSLDRINNNGNYEPGNVRWSTRTDQARNRRSTRSLTFQGETLSLAEWASRLGVRYKLAHARLQRGWSYERVFGIQP